MESLGIPFRSRPGLEFGLKLLLANLSLVILFGAEFFPQRREAIQEQLAHVRHGDGVETSDAFAG